jgi:phosphonate transport system ATP-binding protein
MRELCDSMIAVDNLTKFFGSLLVLKGLSFQVSCGDLVVVLGPSGAGKSTLLRCLNGLVSPSDGSVVIDGIRLERRHLGAVRKRVGFIFQGVNVHGNLTVLQNVLIGRLAEKSPWNVVFSKEDHRVALEAIERVGLGTKVGERASKLSGGQRQRVGIARALAHDPAVLLADEPVSSLDPVTGREILDLLREINRDRGTTVVCNLHDVGLARRVADRILGLRGGEITFDGPPDRLSAFELARIYGDSLPEPEPAEVIPWSDD